MAYLEMNRFRLYSIGSAMPTTVPIEDEWIAWAYAEPREPPPIMRIRGPPPGFPEPGSGGEGEVMELPPEAEGVGLRIIFWKVEMMEVIWSAENRAWGLTLCVELSGLLRSARQ